LIAVQRRDVAIIVTISLNLQRNKVVYKGSLSLFNKTFMPHTAPVCPQCGLHNTYSDGFQFVCPDCAFEWPLTTADDDATTDTEASDGPILDANGNPLADGDAVILIKDLKVKGSSIVLKKGTKVKSIRLPQGAGDHEVDCKTDQGGFMLKACFLKKA